MKLKKIEFITFLNDLSNCILLKLLKEQDLIPIYIPINSKDYYSEDSSIGQYMILVSKEFEYNEKLL